MKRFLVKSSLLLVVFMSILCGVNYFGDAANLYDASYEIRMAEIVESNRNVTNIVNFDERVFKTEIAKRYRKTDSVVAVIGSSRVMMLGTDNLGEPTLNLSMSGARMEDLLGQVALIDSLGLKVKRLIVGIDSWMFNDNYVDSRWTSFEGFVRSSRCIDSIPVEESNKWMNLISFSYFKPSLNQLIEKLKDKKSDPIAIDGVGDETNTFLTDGSIWYKKDFRELSPQEVIGDVKKMIAKDPVPMVGQHDSISATSWAQLICMLEHCTKYKPEILLAPFHPDFYLFAETRIPTIIQVERKVRHLGAEKGITVRGTYDARLISSPGNEFYDYCHGKPVSVKKMYEYLE